MIPARDATALGRRLAELAQAGKLEPAWTALAPIVGTRTSFAILDRIGQALGAAPIEQVNRLAERIAQARTMGGWVVIASALQQQLGRDLPGAFERTREHVIAGDEWYVADIMGERVPGPALLADFAPACRLLRNWRTDDNAWIRRIVGVAAHFWAKRSRGAAPHRPHARRLLALLEPMFGEKQIDAIKGIGWGLKTLGQYYPELTADWLVEQVVEQQRPHRTLMLRKATAKLPAELRARITEPWH